MLTPLQTNSDKLNLLIEYMHAQYGRSWESFRFMYAHVGKAK